ncbi:TIGR02281 family clan AA aspartic protease [Kistimonas scapharcae]|uniref:TIGR02281 family clan AA aspartic protease n=1 Tax=Kistimonas scapharcae TaxID=1036133 RepID=A0ABP8V7C8_9GAMM
MAVIVLACALLAGSVQAVMVQVVGLFPGAAIVIIEGRQVMLKVGNTGPGGVKLLSVDGSRAVLQVNGQAREFPLSRQISNGYKESSNKTIKIFRDNDGHYYVKALVNGRLADMVVDTGATAVGMSSKHANALGVEYKNGEPIAISTASGQVRGFLVQLKSVSIDGLTVRNVDAAIHEGDFPSIILLGMSFLRKVKMRDEGDVLYLEAKY